MAEMAEALVPTENEDECPRIKICADIAECGSFAFLVERDILVRDVKGGHSTSPPLRTNMTMLKGSSHLDLERVMAVLEPHGRL